jgi:hypothetical protein
MKTAFTKSPHAKDLREDGRIILAHGEQTGHAHEVVNPIAFGDDVGLDIPAADFFEEPNGRRVLLINRRCVLRHEEHGLITLDPAKPEQVRQGDVLLQPLGPGAYEVKRQREYSPSEIRTVAD